jgi:enoyl-CoA hydratase/carnithine racemase
MELERNNAVFVLRMNDGDNRIGPAFLEAIGDVLDEVDAAGPPRALVTTGTGRFYSNGFDLDHLVRLERDDARSFAAAAERFLARLLVAPYITVAAINGHCYAAGALLALCHDFRIMRGDRGFLALPSVDVGIPFTRGMTELIQRKIPAPTAQALMVSADRHGGADSAELGIVHRAVAENDVLPVSIARAQDLAAKDPATLGAIKRNMYAAVARLLVESEGTAR